MAVVPTNPLIPHRAFPCRCRKTQQSNPFPPIVGRIPKRLADLANRAEIVMGVQQLLKTPLLALPDRANPDLSKLQVPCLIRPLRRPSFHSPHQLSCPDLSTTLKQALPFTPGPIHRENGSVRCAHTGLACQYRAIRPRDRARLGLLSERAEQDYQSVAAPSRARTRAGVTGRGRNSPPPSPWSPGRRACRTVSIVNFPNTLAIQPTL
jgi:hypothetical protein